MGDEAEKHSLCEANILLQSRTYELGMFTFRRLCHLLHIIFSKRICVVLLILICFLALVEQFLTYNVGIIPSGFYQVLGDKNLTAFWIQLVKSTLLIVGICFVISCKNYVTNVFYVASRDTLTDKLHILYFNNNKFFVMNTLRYDSTDNPDQRITQDVDKFCHQLSSVIGPFVIAPFTISYYSYNCYQTTGWIGPVSVFLIFLLSAFFNKLLMKPIMAKVIEQEKCEGNFRFKHMHVRTNAESVAFQDASIAELIRSDSYLVKLIRTQQSLYIKEFPLDIAVNIFNYIGSIVSYLILAYPIFAGKYSDMSPSELSALISKNAFVSIYLISCFSSLIKVSSTISETCGLVHRVCEILDILNTNNELSDKDECSRDPGITLKLADFYSEASEPAIELKNVTYCAPGETKPLIFDISLQISIGSNLLITGKSSSGKTSLLRVIKGLWPIHDGTVVRRLSFQPSEIFFLPQRPLLSDGSLMEQIIYPLQLSELLKPMTNDIDLILSYLKYVDLQHILKKTGLCDEMDWNWYDVLSPGEAQRLSFVRLFYHKPKLAFLDEATSALGFELEEKLYNKCRELGITVVSVGHRTSLIQFHDNIIHLDGEGGWTLSAVAKTD